MQTMVFTGRLAAGSILAASAPSLTWAAELQQLSTPLPLAFVAAHDMPADLPRFGVVDACALHVDEHNEFYAGNVGEHFHKIYHLLVGFGFVRAHALDDGKRFCRKPGHVGDGFFRFFVAVFADEVRFCQMAEQYGRAQRQTDKNDKFYKQAGIFDCVQHG